MNFLKWNVILWILKPYNCKGDEESENDEYVYPDVMLNHTTVHTFDTRLINYECLSRDYKIQ